MTRIIASILRMAWAGSPRHITLGIAAEVFVYTGILIPIICNLYWTVRFVRAQHPSFGWSRLFSLWLPLWLVVCGIATFCLLVGIPAQFYVVDPNYQRAARQLQLFGAALFAASTILPIPILSISAVAKTHPSLTERPTDHFGQSTLTHKFVLIMISSILLSFGAVFRAATSLIDPPSIETPTLWYFSRASFYIFNFALDFLLITFWLIVRPDEHLLIPDHVSGPMSYGVGFLFPKDRPSSLPHPSRVGSWGGTLRNYMTDDECLPKTPISRLQTADSESLTRPAMVFKGPIFAPRSRGNSFWNSSVTATLTPSRYADSAYDTGATASRGNTSGGETEDMRDFPLAMNTVDLRRATAAALRAAAAGGHRHAGEVSSLSGGRVGPARWQERFNEVDGRSVTSEYSCRTNLAAYTPRI
jgi:hypothetical protein